MYDTLEVHIHANSMVWIDVENVCLYLCHYPRNWTPASHSQLQGNAQVGYELVARRSWRLVWFALFQCQHYIYIIIILYIFIYPFRSSKHLAERTPRRTADCDSPWLRDSLGWLLWPPRWPLRVLWNVLALPAGSTHRPRWKLWQMAPVRMSLRRSKPVWPATKTAPGTIHTTVASTPCCRHAAPSARVNL